MQGRPRVLVLSMYYPSEENSGYGTFVHEQTAALRDNGADVKVFQPLPRAPFPIRYLGQRYREADRSPNHETYQGIDVMHARYLSLPRNWRHERAGDWMTESVQEPIVDLHRRWPFEIINAHTTYPCGYCGNLIRDRRLPDVKVVHTVHRASIIDTPRFSPECSEKVRQSLEAADATVFVSREGLRVAQELAGGRVRKPPVYITNGVNPEKFEIDEPAAEATRLLRQQYRDSTNFLFVGNLCERKGTWELLEAFRELAASEPGPVRLFLVGPNLLGRALKRRLRALELEDRVVLAGPVDHDEVKVWMGAADIFVLPSHSEGVATVLFEALYAGLPCVFTRVGGTEDVVADEETALLVPPGSVESLVEALRRLIRDSALRDKLSRNGNSLVREDYTWDVNARRNLDLFEDLL